MPETRRYAWYVVLALCVSAYFSSLTFVHISQREILKDAAQVVRAAYFLVRENVMGADKIEVQNPKPQARREPLPIIAIAVLIKLHPTFNRPYTMEQLLRGPFVESVKYVNVFWRFLACIFLFLLCKELVASSVLAAGTALTCLILSELLFFSRPGVVDSVMTELPAATLLLVASWSAVRFVSAKTKTRAVWLGISLGALALTKAQFLIVGAGFIGLLFVLELVTLFRGQSAARRPFSEVTVKYMLVALAMLATLGPWVARNFAEFGKPQIAINRGEEVLGIRVFLTEKPLLGAIYAFSPSPVREQLVGPLTGYTPDALERGGGLEDLRRPGGEIRKEVRKRMAAQQVEIEEDLWLRRMALDYVVDKPLRYIASIGVFAYRGMWFMQEGGIIFNALALVCFLGVFLGALVTVNPKLVATFGLGAGLFLFHSVCSHALPRFNAPIIPLVILATILLLIGVTQRISLIFASETAMPR